MIRLNPKVLWVPIVILLVGCSERRSMKRYHVPTAPMEATIQAGTDVLVDQRAYRDADPARWDIVTFEAPPAATAPFGAHPPGAVQVWIMRVVGMPGESVDFAGSGILINDEELELPAFLEGIEFLGMEGMPRSPEVLRTSITLGPDEYFVLGDNSPNANDSRYWGAVSRDRITGKLWGAENPNR